MTWVSIAAASGAAGDHPGSKVNALVDRVAAIWEHTTPTSRTQMIFCDMGVNPTSWGYSAYGEIIDKLTARGIPRAQIAAVGDADSDAKKQALFERVRNGSVRVLIGSTQKMGTGTNVRKRLVALHHLDAPPRARRNHRSHTRCACRDSFSGS